MAEVGPFVTHLIQLTYVKPTDLVPILTPFASPGLANSILPVDGSQILVLRDNSENIKRMLEMVKKVDVSIPSEYVSEVIPIKYALASDIAAALNSLSESGGGATVGGSTARGTNSGRAGTGINRTTAGAGGATPLGSTAPTTGAAPAAGASSFSDRLREKEVDSEDTADLLKQRQGHK